LFRSLLLLPAPANAPPRTYSWVVWQVIKALVLDYAINQPSLEQVFLGFAKQSEAEQAAEREAAEHTASSKKNRKPSWWGGGTR